jgi:hypothetical protein
VRVRSELSNVTVRSKPFAGATVGAESPDWTTYPVPVVTGGVPSIEL